ncbi:unnamed protein product [Acanthosepion pharaonis]|uniref:Uncharacterized protein n=1 Tax=Acanthosepion pharaonis TaxID=158019 RepID=A0A812C0J0_ACAPH|nr:unnamed protein product [Sepia pharaonis]
MFYVVSLSKCRLFSPLPARYAKTSYFYHFIYHSLFLLLLPPSPSPLPRLCFFFHLLLLFPPFTSTTISSHSLRRLPQQLSHCTTYPFLPPPTTTLLPLFLPTLLQRSNSSSPFSSPSFFFNHQPHCACLPHYSHSSSFLHTHCWHRLPLLIP